MSLPKEPRQKMINIMYLVLTALLALNVSSEILNAFKTVRRSLETTNSTVNQSTGTIMKSLQSKTEESDTRERALPWYDKAQKIVKYSSDLNSYIEGIKNEIIKEAGGQPGALSGFKEDNLDIVTRMMVKQKRGKELLAKLNQYSKDVLSIETDPAVAAEFKSAINIDVSNPPGQDGKTKPWEIAYFNMVPTVAGLTILSKFQNDIKTSENKLVTLCHQKVGEVKVVYDAYAAIVGQSSNYLMPGQEMEIKAGIGAFSKSAVPTVSIGGGTFPLGDEGYASKKFNVGGPGTYSVPVRISFFNQTKGKDDVVEKTIEYTVGSPGGASVALDKMNVLYIGVPNPITVASSTGWDKTKVSISGGGGSLTPSGGSGHFIANVNSVTDDCTITVTADGKPSVFKFRVRTVPGAQATIGTFTSGENVPAGTFRAQGGVAAWIKDFPFDLKYTVTQYLISTDDDNGEIVEARVQGNAFDARAQSIIRTHVKPGKTVYVDDIRVQGPDGQNKKVPSLVYYIK